MPQLQLPDEQVKNRLPLTRHEYSALLSRSDAGEISFMFDAPQCKDFLLHADNAEVSSTLGVSLLFESRLIRLMVWILQPLSFVTTIISAIIWLRWWGLISIPVVMFLGQRFILHSCFSRQRIAVPVALFFAGIGLAVAFRSYGAGFMTMTVALSIFYLSVKLAYALPIWFFSSLIFSNYAFVRCVYEHYTSDFHRKLGRPLLYHIDRVQEI